MVYLNDNFVSVTLTGEVCTALVVVELELFVIKFFHFINRNKNFIMKKMVSIKIRLSKFFYLLNNKGIDWMNGTSYKYFS